MTLRDTLPLAVLLAAVVGAAPVASAATCTWNGTAGAWTDAGAWSCNAVPGPADDAVIGAGTVTLAAAAQVRDLTLIGGTLDGPGDLAVLGSLVWEAGTMAGAGTTTVAVSTALRSATAKNIGRCVVLRGLTTWSDGTLQLRDGGVLVNEGVLRDTAVGTHAIARAGTIATEPLVHNRGDWLVESGGTSVNVDVTNEGSLVVGGGGLRSVSPARFTTTAGGTLVGNALLDLASGPTVSAGGTTRPGGAAVASFPVRGSFPMTADHVLDIDLVGPGASDYDRLLVENGTVTVAGRLRVRVGSAAVAGGTYPLLSHTGSGGVVGCYGPDAIDVVEPDGVTAAPYVVTVACTAGGLTATVTDAPTAGDGGPALGAPRLALTGPNPFPRRTTLALTVPASGPVSVDVFDALGRRVAVLFDGAAAADRPVPLAFDAGGLPSGRYVVRAVAGGVALGQPLSVVR